LKQIKQFFNIPPITVNELKCTSTLRGKEIGRYVLRSAFVEIADNMMIEFLQIVKGESIEQKWLKVHGETVHHIAVVTDDLQNEALKWEKKGIEILQEDHGRWIYLNTEKILGMNIELVHPKMLA
jgi:hypothetical protein